MIWDLNQSCLLKPLPETEFSELVQLAAELCECSRGWLSRSDEQYQKFNACYGPELKASELLLNLSKRALFNQQLLIIPDLSCDKNFAEGPLIDELDSIRFYAGLPLISSQGTVWGLLCLADEQAKQLSSLQQRQLNTVAKQILRLLEAQAFQTKQSLTLEPEQIQRQPLQERQIVQEIYILALDSVQAGLWVMPDLQAEALWWSDRTYAILGYQPEAFNPTHSVCQALIHPDDREQVQQDTEAALVSGQTFRTDMRIRCYSGEYLWCQIFGLFSQSEGQTRMTGVIRAIDAERTKNEQLVQSEALLQKMSKLARIGAWVLDPDDERVRWSEELFRIYGLDPKQTPPTLAEAMNYYLPEVMPEIEAAMAEGLQTGQEWELDLPMKTAQNQLIWVRGISQAVRLPDGRSRLYGVVQDITHRKAPRLQRQRLHEYQERLAALSYDINLTREDMLSHALEIALDYFGLSAGVIAHVRGDVFEILALQDQALQVRRPELKPGATVQLSGSFTEWIFGEDQVLSLDEILATSSPEYTELAARLNLHKLIGQVLRVQGERFGPVICYDAEQNPEPFTELEREFMQYFSRWLGFMIERSRYIEHLRQLNRSQNHLLAVVAHDLRNPLGAIKSSKWLLDRQLTQGEPLDLRLLEIIEKSCISANTLIEELLELAEFEQTGQQIVFKPVEMQMLILALTEAFEGAAHKKKLKLVMDLPLEKIHVSADRAKLQRALENLVSNAIKFTPAGGTITLRLKQQSKQVVVTVADTGIGIPVELQSILFDKFTRAGRSGTAGEQSHGLGMHISREIAHLHKGELTVSSEVGQGTCFSLALPQAELL